MEAFLPMDRVAFRDMCRATLAKSSADLELLDRLFDAYWSPLPVAAVVGRAHEPEAPSRPPADGVSAPQTPNPRAPLAMDASGVVRFGLYSPEAPPGGHGFSPLDGRRLAALRTGARRFRRRAATLPGRRFAPAARGRIDFRATARRSLAYGGEALDLRRRGKKPLRASLVILWDVSGSMREHDRTLFALVHALQRAARQSRVFAFSTHLEELTGRLRPTPYARAAADISRSLRFAGGGTRIGRCLQDFRRLHGRLVRGRATVVILSDGWDLGDTAMVGRELEWLHARAHLVAWVNPYARKAGFRPVTAAMREALPYVDVLLGPQDFESRRPFRASGATPPG